MTYAKKLVAFRVVRFAVVGVTNTAVNFAILNFGFYGLHQSKLVSSFIATTCAVVFSFILNRNFVFMDKERPAQKLALFVLITAGGVLLIQNSIYALGIFLLHNHEAGLISMTKGLTSITLSSDFVDVNFSNAIASLCVMAWNYNGYRIFVFNGERHGNDVIETA